MKAKIVSDAITVIMAAWHEGQLVLETDCQDFDAYKALPAAVTYQGVELGKTGWSSDIWRACYKSVAYSPTGHKSGAAIAHTVKR